VGGLGYRAQHYLLGVPRLNFAWTAVFCTGASHRVVRDPFETTSTQYHLISPVFSITYPIKCQNSPLNPDFLPFIAFFVLKGHGFNRITVTHSTHRNFQVLQVGFLVDKSIYARFPHAGLRGQF
jgi:hypothetical protein